MADLTLEPTGEKTFDCPCCGERSHLVWGLVQGREGPRCAYSVSWAGSGPASSDHPPHVTLGYGGWGEGTTAEDRVSIFAEVGPEGPYLVDRPARGASPNQDSVFGQPMPARAVEDDPRSGEVMETIDFILASDGRIDPEVRA